jgi:hypothetical protein
MPTPADLNRVDPDGRFEAFDGFTILPMPGGCIVFGR